MSENAKLAGTVISTALDLGVKDFIICAGARNVPLLADLSERDGIDLWNHFDERSAAFFALGLAKAGKQPAAVVTTSGTAVAELLPAVIEAHYSGIPLILITADRPDSFRGSGAPQAIDQFNIFGGYVSQCVDLTPTTSRGITWDKQSPIHFNVCFEEPVPEPTCEGPPLQINIQNTEAREVAIPELKNPIVLVGELDETDRKDVENWLSQSKIPAWLEATSGLRESPRLADQRIRDESRIREMSPAEVIRIGGVPSLRFWRDLEKMGHIRVVNFTRTPFPGLARRENVISSQISALRNLTGYSHGPNRVQSSIQQGTVAEKLKRHPRSEPSLVAALSRIITQNAAIFLGNSLPIREWNLAADFSIPHRYCFANRGANGIDGEVSSFLGVSRDFEESWGIFGDLTALYDLNAPWMMSRLPAGKRRIVVLNNAGGRIFSRLPAMKQLPPATMAKTENHHNRRFSAWADLWDLEYIRWSDQPEEWSMPNAEHVIIEIKIDQQNSEAFWNDPAT
ncbi:MAG: 2-succinyl-5-enolpyruvyl-6-hydroxy-3-cyclohexene-1-carboxylic-acid synthase [Verrucomicrobiales bacterium]|nr:2-succinyl-5-enolpyruvyl-6-hydroxy-3-cyclohexene-1-carboxylic-acid synthase [Verrucomicrobiales bacterium]